MVLEKQDTLIAHAATWLSIAGRAHRHSLLAVVALVITATGLLSSCNDDKTAVVKHDTDPERVPTMESHDVNTIISDSGRTRYRIVTKMWQIYSEASTPHWSFPNGVQADELDDKFRQVASLICDSAYYNMGSKVWSAVGNVRLTMRNGDKVLCDRMYYDENSRQVNCKDNVRITRTTGDKILTNQMYYETTQALTHSDSFIRIEGQGRVIEGEGYEYYDKQRHYKINHVQGIFPIDDRKFMPRR